MNGFLLDGRASARNGGRSIPLTIGHPSFLNRSSSADKTRSRFCRKHSPPFFSQCFQNQRVIVILIGPRRAGGRQVGAEHERARVSRIKISQSRADVKVHSSEAGGLHPHTFFREFEQGWETRCGETEMVNADRRQRHQRLIKISKLGGINIQLGVPTDELVNPPRHAFQMMNFFRTAALDVKPDGSNSRAVEFFQFLIRDGLRHLSDSDKRRPKDFQSME